MANGVFYQSGISRAEILTNHIPFVTMGQFFPPAGDIMRFRYTFRAGFVLVLLAAIVGRSLAADSAFSVLPGLEGAVVFWKQIFTRYGAGDVVFFDPFDLGKVYSVLRIPDTEEGRVLIERERARILASYDLNEEDGRVKTQRGVKEQFISGLKISGRYMAQMRQIFSDEGLPVELAYLPLVESSFNVRARSTAGAVGMWQFMPDTGKKLLRITDMVDERRDPLASTRAAARLLAENRKLLGNWPLAITAYNHGTEGIFRAIDIVGTRDLVEIIRRYQSPTFGFASKNFYAEFIAAVDIARNSEVHFPFLRPHPPLSLHEIEIKRPVSIQSLLKPVAVSQSDFFDWNPALSPTATTIPAGYRVKLPPEKAGRFAVLQRRDLDNPTKKKSGAVTTRNTAGAASGQIAAKTKGRSVSLAAARSTRGLSTNKSSSAARRIKIASR
jgi:membrane-bound lytic murein transglycosylase D